MMAGRPRFAPGTALVFLALASATATMALARPDLPIGAAQDGAPQSRPGDLGFTDTPMLPGLPYRVHDPARPHPPTVMPGASAGAPPSDATVLFDGTSLARWSHVDGQGRVVDAKWALRGGYVEVVPKTGALTTRERFGDVQLHIEWAAPTEVTRNSQSRGNSGVFLMGLYEVQVLDGFNNPTYADGQAGALYGQWPPLVNAARPPGDWQTYDIVFEAPRFKDGTLVKPAYMTVLWNGVVVHNRTELLGQTVFRDVPKYRPHEPELPLMLQDHGNPVRFRNVWVRRLRGHDPQRK